MMKIEDLQKIASLCATKMITVTVCVDGLHLGAARYNLLKRTASVNSLIGWHDLDSYRAGPFKRVEKAVAVILKKLGEK